MQSKNNTFFHFERIILRTCDKKQVKAELSSVLESKPIGVYTGLLNSESFLVWQKYLLIHIILCILVFGSLSTSGNAYETLETNVDEYFVNAYF